MLTPLFLTPQNLSAIISNAAILAIVAAGQAVVLFTRNLDVSVGSIMGFAAYLTADFAAKNPGVGPLLILMPLAIGAALGTINGLLVAYGRVSPLIATLGTMSLYRGATYIYARGQEVTSSNLPRWMIEFVDWRVAGIPALVPAGRGHRLHPRDVPPLLPDRPPHLRGRLEPHRQRVLRPRTERIVLFAYILTGALCGLAGFLYAARVGTVTVVLASGWELTSLAAAVIGGVSVTGGSGTVIGAALGAIVLATIDNGLVLLRVPEFWRMFIQGSAIVAAATADVLIGRQLRERCAPGDERRGRRDDPPSARRGSCALIVLTICARRMVGLPLALLPEPRPDRVLDAALRLPRNPRARPRRRRRARRDRHLARLDPRLRAVLFSKFSEAGVLIWLAVPCVIAGLRRCSAR